MDSRVVSVERHLDAVEAQTWLDVASRMAVSWKPLGPVGNGRLRGYRFTARVNRLFDFAQTLVTETQCKQPMGNTKEDGIATAAVPPEFMAAPALDKQPEGCQCEGTVATTPLSGSTTATSDGKPSQITLTKCDALEASAKAAWEAYGPLVGGKAFNGDPLPSWETMVANPKTAQIVAGWRAAANAAVSTFFASVEKP